MGINSVTTFIMAYIAMKQRLTAEQKEITALGAR
jgi:hypothetical protein